MEFKCSNTPPTSYFIPTKSKLTSFTITTYVHVIYSILFLSLCQFHSLASHRMPSHNHIFTMLSGTQHKAPPRRPSPRTLTDPLGIYTKPTLLSCSYSWYTLLCSVSETISLGKVFSHHLKCKILKGKDFATSKLRNFLRMPHIYSIGDA